MAIYDKIKLRRLKEARDWPVAEGTVIHFDQWRDEDGLLNVTVGYTYVIDGERYGDTKSLVFKKDRQAAEFEDERKAGRVAVHYQPNKPEVSVLSAELPP
jgi:hypothetical protein